MDTQYTPDNKIPSGQNENTRTLNQQATSLLTHEDILSYYNRVRRDSEYLCEPLEIEDYGIQTMPEVSPPKWHLAHTSWFFETLLLKPFNGGYREYHPKFAILFNSYYDTIGTYHPRDQRGVLSRPSVRYYFTHNIRTKPRTATSVIIINRH